MQDLGQFDEPVILFGGPYSNLQATRAMRDEARARNIAPERVICNGDIVAYCGDPSATVQLVRDWGIPVVMGNCEESLAMDSDDCGCGFEDGTLCSVLSVEWYRFATSQVSAGQRRWMRGLPRRIRISLAGLDFMVVHGSPDHISEFIFPSDDTRAKQTGVRSAGGQVIVGGHSGLPFGQALAGGDEPVYWLNTGVIGMPANDGTRDGWYLLLEPCDDGVAASWHRLPFDTGGATASMRRAGLGVAYRNALESGLWPSMDVLPPRERQVAGLPISLDPLRLRRSGIPRSGH